MYVRTQLGCGHFRNATVLTSCGIWCASHRTEYAFGAHEQSFSGVFETCPGFTFRSGIKITTTNVTSQQF